MKKIFLLATAVFFITGMTIACEGGKKCAKGQACCKDKKECKKEDKKETKTAKATVKALTKSATKA